MDGATLFSELKKILADLYGLPADARRVASDAGLDLAHIPFADKAINTWHNLLAVAIRSGTLPAVLATALAEYGNNPALVRLWATYRDWLAAGGQLDAPALLTDHNIVVEQGDFVGRDKTVYGDEIHGNQIIYQGLALRPVEGAVLDAARAKLAELPLDHLPPIATLSPGSRMPFSANPLFVGREAELRQLAAWLKGGETVAVSQHTGGQMAAVTGMGGLGKTQLAAAFVHHYGHYFQGGVFWLSLADPAAVPAQISACGATMTELRVDYHQLDFSTQVALVLAAWQSALPRLLVFDNCESSALLAQWRPPVGACRVLVTSRRSHFDAALGVQTLPLPTLPRAHSLELLAKFPANVNAAPYTPAERTDLDAIAAALGDLPLALHLAGSFLARYRRVITPAAYLTQVQTPAALEHRSLQSPEVSPTAHDQHVARTFALSYQQLQPADATDALARRLLAHSACFAPGVLIPSELLLLTIVDEDEANADPLAAAMQVEDALRRLTELGLIEVAADGGVILHRLLALFVQQMDQAGYAAAARLVETALLAEADRLNGTKMPQPLLAWQVHLRHRTDLAKGRLDATAAGLCNEMGYHLHMIGEYRTAKPYYERALAIRLAVLGEKHPDTARSLNNLGALLNDMGELTAAKPYYERALAIHQAVLGDQHPDTATSLNNLGFLLQAMRELAAAKPYYERALAIQLAVLGDQHPDTAFSLNNLGTLLQAMGELTAAKPHYERALAIRLAVLGDQHPDTARSLNNLGALLRAMGELAAAKPYYERALAIHQAVLGDQHPNTAFSLNNLGFLLRTMGELAAAKPYYERALIIFEERLGSSHPYTEGVRNNLASLIAQLDGARSNRSPVHRALRSLARWF